MHTSTIPFQVLHLPLLVEATADGEMLSNARVAGASYEVTGAVNS